LRANDDQPYLSLILPAYNEAGRIANTIQVGQDYLNSLGESWELIIVDDGSTDGTLERILSCGDESDRLRVITYQPNRGKGFAVRQGVLASRGKYVAFSDVDMSAPFTEFPKLFDAIRDGYDIAIGSRAVKGALLEKHQPLYRELGGKGLNLVIRLLATPGIHDTQCGFKLFRGDLAREVFGKCFINSWGFDVEVLYLARRLGCTIAEIGVKWSHAEGSTIRPFRAALRVIWDVIRMRAHK
jgi:dolichyl-phosphate beta-glucosyltransferase